MPDSIRTSDLNEIVPIPVTEPPYRIYPYNYSYIGDTSGPKIEQAVTNSNVVPAQNYPRIRASTHAEVSRRDPWVPYNEADLDAHTPLHDGWEYETQHFTLGKDKRGQLVAINNDVREIPPDITVPVGEEILPLRKSVEGGDLPPGSVQANKRFSPLQPHEVSPQYISKIPGVTYGMGNDEVPNGSVEEPPEVVIPNGPNDKLKLLFGLGAAGALYFLLKG